MILPPTIANMPLFATSEQPAATGETGLFAVHRWLPCEDASMALVILDHELIGDAVIGAAKALLAGGEIGPVAIYSVGFDTDRFGDLYAKRAEHLTMETVDLGALGITKTGRGATLLAFLIDSLIPAIELELPHLATRPALAGYSLSGLFALQVATQYPHIFGDISAWSPSLFLDREVQAGVAGLLAQDASRRLFLAAGRLEQDREQTGLSRHMFELVAEMGATLERAHGDRVTTKIVQSETHFSLPFTVVPAMLRHFYGERETLRGSGSQST